jgi:hypothetical protein
MATVVRRCPVCGVPGHTCGPRTTVAGLDPSNAPRRERAVGPLREYHVIVNGAPTTMLLNDKDAERLGGTPVGPEPEVKAELSPPNKARRPRNKVGSQPI